MIEGLEGLTVVPPKGQQATPLTSPAPPSSLAFSFAIDDESVTLVGHDPTLGLPPIHAESNHPAARAWLEHEYEQIRVDAAPVHTDEIPSSEE